jgi:hypothetical protein
VRIVKQFFMVLAVLFVATGAGATELRGTASVNVTSDTAVNAKNMAFDDATRQIVTNVLRQYVDVDALTTAVKEANKSELSNLILSSSIDGEQTSDTTYSANVSMIIDVDAARAWLDEKEIQHWLPNNTEQNMFNVVVTLSNRLADWAQLNQIANTEKIDLGTKNINGNVVTLQLPTSVRGAFTIAVRGSGWKYSDKDGILHIWK